MFLFCVKLWFVKKSTNGFFYVDIVGSLLLLSFFLVILLRNQVFLIASWHNLRGLVQAIALLSLPVDVSDVLLEDEKSVCLGNNFCDVKRVVVCLALVDGTAVEVPVDLFRFTLLEEFFSGSRRYVVPRIGEVL